MSPHSGATRERYENDTAMQSMIAESTKSASGAPKPAATTIGPIVDASEYAGPIEAEASTEISKKWRTRGRRRVNSGRSRAASRCNSWSTRS